MVNSYGKTYSRDKPLSFEFYPHGEYVFSYFSSQLLQLAQLFLVVDHGKSYGLHALSEGVESLAKLSLSCQVYTLVVLHLECVEGNYYLWQGGVASETVCQRGCVRQCMQLHLG